ncbi:MAG: hypothetical protein O3A95_07470 [Planctomycetota bacterium]|nr:hypothetical protein [Planctomycetota bacterium]MDA1114123.1 hypothetical protein [Planctomycetota bacterium]
MSDSLEPLLDQDQQLARQAATQSGSLLRLRDVQALNRSFRRLAEVQESLLDRLESLEEEKSAQNRANGPLMAMGGVILGCGLALVAFVMWQDKSAGEVLPVVVQQEPAVVNVPPAEITVQGPDNTELVAAFKTMNANMEKVIAGQASDREQLGDLTAKLLLSEEEKLNLMKEFALAEEKYKADVEKASKAELVQPLANVDLNLPGESTAVEPASVAAKVLAPAITWVGVVNGLLAADGYSALRLQQATRVPGKAALADVTWMSWNREGLVDTIVHADRLEFEMHRMSGVLVLRFFDGSLTAEGLRTALPEAGMRLDLESQNLNAWMEHFPELKESTLQAAPVVSNATPNSEGVTPPAGNFMSDAHKVRKALDDLISLRGSFSFYRLSSLESVDGNLLRLVQINWHDNSGRLVKTIEADSLEVILHKNSSVELLLRKGAFLDGSKKSPFSSDRFSLHLPRQDISAWRASGVPFTDSSQ